MSFARMRMGSSGKLLVVSVVICLLKGICLLLDPTPSYFFGDSESYLASATLPWIPPDRSFLYGMLIRGVALQLHSLQTLIYLQVLCSCAACWLLCYSLFRNLQTRFAVAAVFAIFCAVEPLQLLMERYVMTEATSNLLFALHLALILGYLKHGKLWVILLAQAAAIVLISIRISFLPVVLMNSFLVPLLSPAAIKLYRSLIARFREREARPDLVNLKTVVVHVLLSLLVIRGLMGVYGHWYGYLMQREPAIFYAEGAFLIADIAPLVRPGDFPPDSHRNGIFKRVTIHQDMQSRLAHHFLNGGLWMAIQGEYPDPRQANEVAVAAAKSAVLRDPLGAMKMAAQTYALYFSPRQVRSELLVDEGADDRLGSLAKTWLRTLYGVKNPQGFQLSLTKRWHRGAFLWYWIILGTLTASPALLLLTDRKRLPSMIVIVTTALVFLGGVTVTVDHPTPRYLTTDAWLALLLIGTITDALISRFLARSSRKPPFIVSIPLRSSGKGL